MTRVTDTVTDTGPTTTFAYPPGVRLRPAKYIGKPSKVTAPGGEQTVYCPDPMLRGDKRARVDAGRRPRVAAQQPADPVTASARVNVAATTARAPAHHQADRGARRRRPGPRLRRPELRQRRLPARTSKVLRPQWFAPGDRKVEVISTDQVNNKRKDERTIKVPSEPSNTAGLEQWYQYNSVSTGAGTEGTSTCRRATSSGTDCPWSTSDAASPPTST